MNIKIILKYFLLVFLAFVPCRIVYAGENSQFDYTTQFISPSPAKSSSIAIPKVFIVRDIEVSPLRPVVLLIIENADKSKKELKFFEADLESGKMRLIPVPKADTLDTLAWHPNGKDIFVLGKLKNKYIVWKSAYPEFKSWKNIYETPEELKRLLVTPTKFYLYGKTKIGGEGPQYRLYLGVKLEKNVFGIRAITENGELPYNAIAPKKYLDKFLPAEYVELLHNNGEPASAKWALPVDFHPSGKRLLWEDHEGNYHTSQYYDNWNPGESIKLDNLRGSTISYTPNGSGLSVWNKKEKGIKVYFDEDKQKMEIAQSYNFDLPPVWMPDGKGIAGIVSDKNAQKLIYETVKIPLADVANAWLFVSSPVERKLLDSNGGLFIKTCYDQLYNLYESEYYYCGDYDFQTPTSPFLVTTDIFWEVFAASFEGTFQVLERYKAVPAFWDFVKGANEYFSKQKCGEGDRLCGIFSTLYKLKFEPGEQTPEEKRILDSNGYSVSDVLGVPFEYEDLKPRGHYTRNDELKLYFRALRYFAAIDFNETESEMLNKMPDELKEKAGAFIKPYLFFIAPSRYKPALDLGNNFRGIPDYIKHLPDKDKKRMFPLSFGFDNEVISSTIYHGAWPAEDQVISIDGKKRLLPDSLEFPAVTGSSLAWKLLDAKGLFKEYPNLTAIMNNLKKRWSVFKPGDSEIYSKWLEVLGTQWSDEVLPPPSGVSPEFWKTKRLQTGLASWTTLRHATVLVNEREGAECGEAGFEPIIVEPPLGAVEPDPDTFAAIAALFDMEIKMVQEQFDFSKMVSFDEYDSDKKEALRDGILRRLKESRDNILNYREMAKKQMAGKALTPDEYERIFYVGRAAEHNFIVFKSLADDNFGLPTPDPVTKVVDIAGGGVTQSPYLHAAVGRPAEWDLIVPHFGRRQVVKGVVYTYQSSVEDKIINDEEWRKIADKKPPVDWTLKYYSDTELSCPAVQP